MKWPGVGMAAGPDGVAVGPPDDFEAVGRALGELQGDGKALLLRMYVLWSGPESTAAAQEQVAQIAGIVHPPLAGVRRTGLAPDAVGVGRGPR